VELPAACEEQCRNLSEAMNEATGHRNEFSEEGRPGGLPLPGNQPGLRKQTGIKNAQGRWMVKLPRTHEQHWFDLYGQVAKTR